MGRNEQTSKDVASKASRVLRDPNASPEAKSVAASALSQAPDTGTDGPVRRLSPEGPSPETTTMTKAKDKDDKVKEAVEDKTTAGATEEQKTDKTGEESAEDAHDKAEDAAADRASRGDPNAGAQDEGRQAKGPGQDSGDTTKIINADDLPEGADPTDLANTAGLDNEDVVLTDHDPATKPEQPINKLEADQLHHAGDGRIRTGEGKVAWAAPGSYDAAKNGVQQDASGSFTSANLPAGARIVQNAD